MRPSAVVSVLRGERGRRARTREGKAMSTNQTTTSSNESRKTQLDSCCGGPAPAGVSACCAQDAEVKSSGGTGCGCLSQTSAAPRSTTGVARNRRSRLAPQRGPTASGFVELQWSACDLLTVPPARDRERHPPAVVRRRTGTTTATPRGVSDRHHRDQETGVRRHERGLEGPEHVASAGQDRCP
jgi:hypothetical protein